MLNQDTIISLATVAGESALGIIRISGSSCNELCLNIFNCNSPTPRTALVKNYISIDGEIIDQIVFIFYENGKSYTGEELIEISFHGNQIIANSIINDLLKRNCRLAEPGEYTKRAFLNGKIDLTQAESVAELISAKSEIEIKLANNRLQGNLSKKLKHIQKTLVTVQSKIEASIDFPEEEISKNNKNTSLHDINDIKQIITELIESEKINSSVSSGIIISLIGPPNVGKSSIFNKLVYEKRSIIDKNPGTTRDYISKEVIISGFASEIIDTAGIRKSNNSVEQLGVQNSKEIMLKSNIVLFVLDSSKPFPTEFYNQISSLFSEQYIIIIENKSDLPKKIKSDNYPVHDELLSCSAINKNCAEVINDKITKVLKEKYVETSTKKIIVNKRHQLHLQKTQLHLIETGKLISNQLNEEIILQELKLAMDAINQIIGIKDNEDMLDELFKNFCIGK